ncbi:Ig-like domain-containing protein [Moritella sp. PE36]|uniref:Ig-like domain-containing protein n=1 Tax=Moritella sp. PE36 TaxID=58051 RepID=UPI001E5A7114|nr:Ig-like domain-containing protein [Moritella sp. PE36]
MSISTLLTVFPVTAQPKGNPLEETKSIEITEHRKLAQNKTIALAKLMANYRHADKSNNEQLLNELIEQAKARQSLLAELVKNDPSAAIRASLPKHVRAGIPAEVLALLEQKQELNGELEVIYEDYKDPSLSRLRHFLVTDNSRVELYLPENSKGKSLQSGVNVRASGWLFKQGDEAIDSLALYDDPDSLTVLALDNSATTTSSSATSAVLPNTIGEQHTLVLLVNFQDNPTEQPWTKEQVQNMIFGTVNDYYQEASYGQTSINGDVLGYYTLPIDSVCDHNLIYNAAQQVAANNNINTNNYDRLLYVFPKIDNCGWAGKGTVGGSPSRAWINGDLTLSVVGHELGHNLGLRHAKKLECGTNVLDGDCYTIEYGDSLEIMGNPGFTGHFNSFNKELLGWLSEDPSTTEAKIQTVETAGSFEIEPYASSPNGSAKALKIQRGIDSVTGQKLWYYLEYRQPLGFDAYIASYPALHQGINFHLGTEKDTNSSQLIDMTPASSYTDWNDAVLPVGASYEEAGIVINTNWANSNGANVSISFTGPSCVKKNPSLLLSSDESAWVTSGTTVTYSATVTNQNSSGCASSDFSVVANVPADWSANSHSISLAPGASGSVTINITSASLASDGFYDIAINATNNSDSSYNTSSIINYIVDTPVPACVVANPMISLSGPSGNVTAGTTVNYIATVANLDSVECAEANFDVFANIPTGWSANNASVNLAPGASSTVILTITSNSTATDGVYMIVIIGQNTANNSLSNSGVVSYAISIPDQINTAPIAVSDSVALLTKEVISIDVLSNDWDPEGDSLTIISTTQGSKGSVLITTDGHLLYTPAKNFKTSDSFTYTISDGLNSATAIVSISLNSTGGGKGQNNKGKGK